MQHGILFSLPDEIKTHINEYEGIKSKNIWRKSKRKDEQSQYLCSCIAFLLQLAPKLAGRR